MHTNWDLEMAHGIRLAILDKRVPRNPSDLWIHLHLFA